MIAFLFYLPTSLLRYLHITSITSQIRHSQSVVRHCPVLQCPPLPNWSVIVQSCNFSRPICTLDNLMTLTSESSRYPVMTSRKQVRAVGEMLLA